MTHRPFVMLFCLLLGICSLSFAPVAAAERPHIVILLADDLGWADVSFHGDQIKTPNLDRLVSEGAELTRFYVCPVCSPTRAGLMTGRYPIRYGLMRAVLPPWRRGGLDVAEVTMPEVLAQAGYKHRGIFGKWHLGHSDVQYHPLRRGFTEFVGHYNGAIDYFTHQRDGMLDWHRDHEPNRDEGYSTDLIAEAAVQFINRHAGDDSPLLCYVPFNAPHSPLQAKDEDLARYRHLTDAEPRLSQPPGRAAQGNGSYGARGRGKNQRQTLAAMISSMDQGIGRILEALKANGIDDNTLVWFFSDNGGVAPGDNRPLRGAKASVFEGGVRVPSAVRWPDRIPAGGKIDTPLAYIDVLPTLMRVAGIEAHGGKPLDGMDVLDVLTGQREELRRELYNYIGQQGEADEQLALIDSPWKLIVSGMDIRNKSVPQPEREILLFQLNMDPYEEHNVADMHPQIVDRMWDKLVAFRELQPAGAVPPYNSREDRFEPLPDWKMPDHIRSK